MDATNFGWLAVGQPTHVFDLDTLQGGIVVRRALLGERLRLLDGTERTLTGEDLVVADERKALGLAGVMGGWDSRVTEATKNILVEAAWFDPAAIRASSRRHGLHTDASHRFERGADFDAAPMANHLVTRLVLEQAGGAVAGPLVDIVVSEIAARTSGRAPVILRVDEVQRLLGTTREDAVLDTGQRTSGLNEAIVAQYLTALGCDLAPTGVPAEFAVGLPSWRLDLEREIDLIEEIARVYGYNRFANTLPGWAGEVRDLPHKRQAAAVRSTLRALGYTEAISSTFVSAAEAAEFGRPGEGVVPIGNPLSEEAGTLRPSLLPGMAGMLARNLARGLNNVRLFELGTVFTGSAAGVHEGTGLALGTTGEAVAGPLHRAEDALLFAVKGALERLLSQFTGEIHFEALDSAAWVRRARRPGWSLAGAPAFCLAASRWRSSANSAPMRLPSASCARRVCWPKWMEVGSLPRPCASRCCASFRAFRPWNGIFLFCCRTGCHGVRWRGPCTGWRSPSCKSWSRWRSFATRRARPSPPASTPSCFASRCSPRTVR